MRAAVGGRQRAGRLFLSGRVSEPGGSLSGSAQNHGPVDRRSPLPGLPGAPFPGYDKYKRYWCYWGRTWPGDDLPGFPCLDRALPKSFIRGRGRGSGAGAGGWVGVNRSLRRTGSPEQHLPKPLQRNPPPGVSPTSLLRRTSPGRPPASRRGRDTRGPSSPCGAPCVFLQSDGQNGEGK